MLATALAGCGPSVGVLALSFEGADGAERHWAVLSHKTLKFAGADRPGDISLRYLDGTIVLAVGQGVQVPAVRLAEGGDQ